MLATIGLLASACSGAHTLKDCTDTPCRQAWLDHELDDHPEEVVAALERIEDPVLQLQVALLAAHQSPRKAGRVCRVLPSNESKQRCLTVTRRPHLQDAPPRANAHPAPGPPPDDVSVRLLGHLQGPPWSAPPEVEPDPGPCTPTDVPCLQAEAVRVVRVGSPEDVLALCSAIQPERARDECTFKAAEALVSEVGEVAAVADSVGAGLSLCGWAGAFRSHCVAHLADGLAARVPPLEAPAEAWLALDHALADAKKGLPDTLHARFVDYVWSRALQTAVRRAGPVQAPLATTVPPDAQPHLRAAVAWRVMGHAQDHPEDLSTMVDQVLAILSGAAPLPPRHQDTEPKVSPLRRHWAPSEGWDGPPVSIHFLGDAVRMTVEDPHADTTICVLEAGARLWPSPRAVLDAGRDSAIPTVRWTAEKLDDPADFRK